MKTNRLFLDIHVIQTVPPSNINRDDTGSPKTAQYGGVRRARVSSQAWKRAMRDYFYKNSEQTNVGVRSLDIVDYVARKIVEIDANLAKEEALAKAEKTLNGAAISTKDGRAKALFFLGDQQANRLAQAAIDGISDKKQLQTMIKENPAIDIALFGRMVADDPSLNEDASSQIAHAISTHAVQTEFDFYTAVDDLAPEDNAGAGMLGTIEYNASTLYRYGNVAVHELLHQLTSQEAVINTLKLFVESFANSMPTGKVNTFANQTLPQMVLVTLREDRPVNLVSAFEKPVQSNEGYVKDSIHRLLLENKKVEKFVKSPVFNAYVSQESVEIEGDMKNQDSLQDLLNNMGVTLQESIEEM